MQSSERILRSLRSRTWLAVSGLAVLNCALGLIIFLSASFFFADGFPALVVTFLATAFATMVFGWWLSNDVLHPIEMVSLLAKSLERSPSASLPKTTGTAETDEILFSLHRTSRQLNNLVNLMDDVAAGKTDAASIPLETSDRLSTAFQKLVAKVTDSIDAKRELDEIRGAVDKLKQDVSGVRHDSLNTVARDDDPITRPIADSINHLAEKLRQVVRQIRVSSMDARNLVESSRSAITLIADRTNSDGRKLATATTTVSDSTERLLRITKIVEDSIISDSGTNDGQEGFRELLVQQAARLSRLTEQLTDVFNRLESVREMAQSVDRSARIAGEISRKANLLALNTSLPCNGSNAVGFPVGFISEEIASVSQKTETVRKEIGDIGEALVREMTAIQMLVKSINAEALALADQHSVEESIAGLEAYLERLRKLPTNILPIAEPPTVKNKPVLDELCTEAAADSSVPDPFEVCSHDLSALNHILENLSNSVSDLGVQEQLPQAVRMPIPVVQDTPSTTISESTEGSTPDLAQPWEF
jgi:methyl-accepting chemotaxis protein